MFHRDNLVMLTHVQGPTLCKGSHTSVRTSSIGNPHDTNSLLKGCSLQTLRTALSSREPVRQPEGNEPSSGSSSSDNSEDPDSDEEVAAAGPKGKSQHSGQGFVQMDAELDQGQAVVGPQRRSPCSSQAANARHARAPACRSASVGQESPCCQRLPPQASASCAVLPPGCTDA